MTPALRSRLPPGAQIPKGRLRRPGLRLLRAQRRERAEGPEQVKRDDPKGRAAWGGPSFTLAGAASTEAKRTSARSAGEAENPGSASPAAE